jgi:hypothetical protein
MVVPMTITIEAGSPVVRAHIVLQRMSWGFGMSVRLHRVWGRQTQLTRPLKGARNSRVARERELGSPCHTLGRRRMLLQEADVLLPLGWILLSLCNSTGYDAAPLVVFYSMTVSLRCLGTVTEIRDPQSFHRKAAISPDLRNFSVALATKKAPFERQNGFTVFLARPPARDAGASPDKANCNSWRRVGPLSSWCVRF